MNNQTRKRLAMAAWRLLPLVALLVFPAVALALEAGLPYESGLDLLEESFKGPVPTVISLAGIVGCGAMLIFGGEISGFMRTMVFIVLVVAVIVQASNIIEIFKPASRSVAAAITATNSSGRA
ncbi:TrbC/VirB2 family protein [Luteibacter sp. SG786]|uniref:TrbC/VirB2 family protein n=1 Tax=Luteibacter sp. SG786 TaxID=2587130 RepID=UPI0014221675|nr:TrbC/VirB2 family protein [Luteibacter sp. SG786]NII55485.1 type IV secretion system protein VirB2 [Luteibacter sp. SG786]